VAAIRVRPNRVATSNAPSANLAPWRSLRRLRYADFNIQTGDLEAAKQMLDAITQKAPDYIPARNRLAEIAFHQQKYDDCDKLIKSIQINLRKGDTATVTN